MKRLARVVVGLVALAAFLVALGLCGCKGKSGLDPNDPGPDIKKSATEKATTMMKGKGPGDPPAGLGGD